MNRISINFAGAVLFQKNLYSIGFDESYNAGLKALYIQCKNQISDIVLSVSIVLKQLSYFLFLLPHATTYAISFFIILRR